VGGGRGESPSEESHSAVKVPAIVRGSRVPAEEADKVPAKEGRSSTVQADLTRGKREREGSPKPRSTNAEDRNRVTTFRMPTVPTEQLRRECNTREQGHQGNYFTDSPRLATVY